MMEGGRLLVPLRRDGAEWHMSRPIGLVTDRFGLPFWRYSVVICGLKNTKKKHLTVC